MAPISRTLNTMAYNARIKKETTDGKLIIMMQNFTFLLQRSGKRSLNIAEVLKT